MPQTVAQLEIVEELLHPVTIPVGPVHEVVFADLEDPMRSNARPSRSVPAPFALVDQVPLVEHRLHGREDADQETPTAEARRKLEYDLYYVRYGNTLLDAVILLQTVRVMLWPSAAH